MELRGTKTSQEVRKAVGLLAGDFSAREIAQLLHVPKRTVNNLLREVRLQVASEELERKRQEEKFWQALQAERDMLRQGDPGLRVPVRRYSS
jgi:plasmid maintenance system antidote protein VapI